MPKPLYSIEFTKLELEALQHAYEESSGWLGSDEYWTARAKIDDAVAHARSVESEET